MIEQAKPSRIVSVDPLRGKDRILRIAAIRQRFDPPPARATLYRWAKEGIIPPPFNLNGRPAWLESTIDNFIASQMAKPRDPKNDPSNSNAAYTGGVISR